ncbi:MAG: hypothetical protein R2788_14005 [Saprospiraceae bacterium]
MDKSSTGLILLTNDGDIVNEILREKNNNEKGEYIVTVCKPVTQRFVQRMSSGIPISKTVTNNCLIGKNW